jgi:hypothetical protein
VFLHIGVLFYGSGFIKVRNLKLSIGTELVSLPSMPSWKKQATPIAWLLFLAWKDETSIFSIVPVELVASISECIGLLVVAEFSEATTTKTFS